MTIAIESLARDEADSAAARGAIWSVLGAPGGYRAAYAALCRWTWRAMIERRLDDDLRRWHRLLLDAAAKIGTIAADAGADSSKIVPTDAAQRIRALADLVRLSIDAAKVADVADFTGRAHVIEILRMLAAKSGEFVLRDAIRTELGLGNANLSRILSLLAVNGLVEREARERQAAFRATQRAIRIVEQADARSGKSVVPASPPPPAITAINPRGQSYVDVITSGFRTGTTTELKSIKVGKPIKMKARVQASDGIRVQDIYSAHLLSKEPTIEADPVIPTPNAIAACAEFRL